MKYKKFWLVFVNLKAKEGFNFEDLVDFEDSPNDVNYKGAWANVIVKSKNINNVPEIVALGLDELDFEIVFIDKIENIGSLIEHNEINNDIIGEVDWLSRSKFVFKISNRLFPYK